MNGNYYAMSWGKDAHHTVASFQFTQNPITILTIISKLRPDASFFPHSSSPSIISNCYFCPFVSSTGKFTGFIIHHNKKEGATTVQVHSSAPGTHFSNNIYNSSREENVGSWVRPHWYQRLSALLKYQKTYDLRGSCGIRRKKGRNSFSFLLLQ